MSVFGNLFRALGFGGGNDDDDIDMQYDVEESAGSSGVESHQATESDDGASEHTDNESGSQPARESDKPEVSSGNVKKCDDLDVKTIFDGVVSVLNRNLPPYLKECLDNEEQCRFIYENLDKDLKEYISALARGEAEKASRRWAAERKKLSRQVNEAAEQIAQASERIAKAEEKALSADRQKRAMTQRNADLERRIARLQADIEQYDLEKTSLLNKLRVVEVKAGRSENETREDATVNSAENERLTQDLENARAEIAELKTHLAEANKSLEVVGEIQQQLQGIEAMKKRKNARIKELKDENTQLRAELESIESTRRNETPIVEQPEPEPADAVVDQSDAQQPADVGDKDESQEVIDMTLAAPASYEPDATGVSAVIADDLDMLAAISENDAMADSADIQPQPARKKRKPRSRKPKLVAIDESISESEWLLSSSPVPQDVNSPSGFGYQEPPRRNALPDNPAQMSLW